MLALVDTTPSRFSAIYLMSASLAVQVDGVGKESISISVVHVLLSSQALDEFVAVSAKIVSALDLSEMSSLVDVGASLVLLVALLGDGGKLLEVKIAVGHEALAGQGVGENTILASLVGIGAVVLGDTLVGGATLLGNLAEHGVDNGAGLVVGGLEVFFELGAGTCDGGLLGLLGDGSAVLESLLGDLELVAGAVALDFEAALVEGHVGLGSLEAIDLGGDLVGVEGDGADKFGRVLVGEGEDIVGEDAELAAVGEIVDLGDVESDINGAASGDSLEVLLSQAGSRDLETETIKLDVLGCFCKYVLAKSVDFHDGENCVLTTSRDASLLNSLVVKNGTSLEDLEVLLAVVGERGLDFGVSNHLKLDAQSCRSALLVLHVEGGGRGHRGERGDTNTELHLGERRMNE